MDDTIEPYFHLRKEENFIIPIPVRDEKGKYHLWISNVGNYNYISPQDLAVSDYFSRTVASPDDIFFPFINFLYQRCRNVQAIN